ncbi:hypothetical protein DV068_10795 [Neisseria gonorrhoeae]
MSVRRSRPSFPHRRESGFVRTETYISSFHQSRPQPTFPRHSRAGGNPVRSVSVISDKFLLLFIPRFPLSRE